MSKKYDLESEEEDTIFHMDLDLEEEEKKGAAKDIKVTKVATTPIAATISPTLTTPKYQEEPAAAENKIKTTRGFGATQVTKQEAAPTASLIRVRKASKTKTLQTPPENNGNGKS